MTPYPDRTLDEWKGEIYKDMSLITRYANWALQPEQGDSALNWALAIKEARRLHSDLYRMAEVAGVSREDIDAVGPL